MDLKTSFLLFCDVNFRWRENARVVAQMGLTIVFLLIIFKQCLHLWGSYLFPKQCLHLGVLVCARSS